MGMHPLGKALKSRRISHWNETTETAKKKYNMIPTTLDGGDLENVTYIFHMLKMQVLEILHFPHLKYENYHM